MEASKVEFNELKLALKNSFANKVNELENIKNQVDSDDVNMETISSLNFLSHNLSGSLALFGFKEIEPISRALENKTFQILGNKKLNTDLNDIRLNLNILIELLKNTNKPSF